MSLPLSCDFVEAIDFQLHPAPPLKPQKSYGGGSIWSLMRIFGAAEPNSGGQLRWAAEPGRRSGVIVAALSNPQVASAFFNPSITSSTINRDAAI